MQAVIFDLDGVLTNTVEYHFESWRKVLGDYGIEITREDNEQLLGLTRRRSLEVLLKGREFPEGLLREMLRLKNKYYLEFVDEIGPRDLAPGIPILLQELRLSGIRIGVASASQNVRPVLQNLGIDGFIQAQTDGVTVRRSKPAPDVFLQTCASLQVNPENCLAIEDSEAGIQAACAAGMVVIGLGPTNRVDHAHAWFDDLSGIRLNDLREIFYRIRLPAPSLEEIVETQEMA